MPKKNKKTTSNSQFNLIIVGSIIFVVLLMLGIRASTRSITVSSPEQMQEEVITLSWRDTAQCEAKPEISTVGWQTFSDSQVSFQYPRTWKLTYDTQAFEHGDLVQVSYVEMSDIPFTGGGGNRSRGGSIIFAQPVTVDSTVRLEEYVTGNIIYKVRQSTGITPMLQRTLQLGNEPAVGVLLCRDQCTNHLTALKNQQVFHASYTVWDHFDEEKNLNIEQELCGIISTVQIQ